MAPTLPLLLALVLAGCGGDASTGPDGPPGPGPDVQGPGPSGPQPERRPSDALQPKPDAARDKSTLQEPGPEVKLELRVEPRPVQDRGQFVFVGVPAGEIEEGWVRTGRRPSFFWVSPIVSLDPPIEVMAPLPPGLSYFAVLNLDGDDLPGPDDRVSGAVPFVEGAASLRFVVGPRLGDLLPDQRGSDEGDGAEERPADDHGGEPRVLVIRNDVRLPFIRTGRFMVVGLPPSPEDEFGFPPDSTPSYLWISEATRLKWPVTLEAKLPDAVDLLVVLDLDASGAPDVGDLTTEPIFAFRRPPEGESVEVTLETVVPVPEGEANEDRPQGDGQPIEGPAEPGDAASPPPGAILVAPTPPPAAPNGILLAPAGSPSPTPP